MKQNDLKKEIEKACTPPKPKRKDSFLAALSYPKLTYPEFIISQINYIRKRIWFVSAMIFLMIIGMVCVFPEDDMALVWTISALIPFLAVLTAAELSRSDIFGMSELEAGCRFSLPQIVGARTLILGICNFSVIAAISAILGVFSPMSIEKSALYIFTPFVSVNGIALSILNRVKGQDGVYLSAVAALIVSLSGVIFFGKEMCNERTINTFMSAVCAAGTVLTTIQIKKLLFRKDTEYGIKH